MQTTKNLYELLGLPEGAPQEDIRRVHRKLVRKYHPDTNPEDPQAEERFKEVQRAYEVLSDPQKRREYDQGLRASSRKGGTGREGTETTRADPGRPRQSSAGRRAGGTAYTVDLSELLAKLVNLSSERAKGRTEGNFQLQSEEVAQLAKVLGEEISRISELLGKDTASLLRQLNEKMKRNATADSEEARPGGFSTTNEETSGERAYSTNSRKPREKKVKGPRAQGRTKTVKGPGARRNERRKRSS
jgi:curved DNA-binding protein CbpA